ncbi:hypothetical protein TWF696_006821 [Orbilia brochopaga]|uniref:Uncharacterized protein n=1 Tax=Orbilia brochopaga TaxID=3140254 RepID=A0AAV9UPV9_9PEZI
MFWKMESTNREYLPCHVKLKGSNILSHGALNDDERKRLAGKIIEISLTLGENRTASTPRPLVFTADPTDLSNVILEPPVNVPTGSQSLGEFEPHFWIPDSCLVGLDEREKALRREVFAVGCLVFSITQREKPWAPLSAPLVQDMYQRGVYPGDVLDSPYWLQILLLWSEEFAKWIEQQNNKSSMFGTIKKVAVGTAVAGAVVGGAALAAPAAIAALGFGSAGVGAGTIAAGWQASMGSVAAGSLFAFFQSVGAGGAALGVISQIAAGGLGAGGAAAALGYVAGTAENCNATGEGGQACVKEELFRNFLAVVKRRATG